MRPRSVSVLALFLACVFLLAGGASATSSSNNNDEDAGVLTTRYLTRGGCNIYKVGSNTLKLTGFTEANQIVDEISVTLYLQRLEESTWKDVAGGYRRTVYDTIDVTHAVNVIAAPGYYYRTRAVHQVIHNGIVETKQSTSASLYL